MFSSSVTYVSDEERGEVGTFDCDPLSEMSEMVVCCFQLSTFNVLALLSLGHTLT